MRDGRELLRAARELAVALAAPELAQVERTAGAFTVVVARRDGQVRLTLVHRDRQPSAEEMGAVGEALAMPGATDFHGRVISLISQDGRYRRLPALTATWREV